MGYFKARKKPADLLNGFNVTFSEAVPARDPAADEERLDVRRREQRRRPPAQDLLPDGRARQGEGAARAPLQRPPQHQERRQPRRLRKDNRARENRRRAGAMGGAG